MDAPKGSPIAWWFWWFGRSIWPARKWTKWCVWIKLKKLKLHLMCLQRMMSWRPAMKNFMAHIGLVAALGNFGMWTGNSTNIFFWLESYKEMLAAGSMSRRKNRWFSHLSSIWPSLVGLGLDCHLFHASCHNHGHGRGHEISPISPLQVSVDQALHRLDGIVEAGKVVENEGVAVVWKISVFHEMPWKYVVLTSFARTLTTTL